MISNKILIIASLLFASVSVKATSLSDSTKTQNNSIIVFLDGKAGIGQEGKGNRLVNFAGGLNVILKNNIYLRLGTDAAVGGRLYNFNSTVGYNHYSLTVGLNDQVSDNFRITPYIGIGYLDVNRTARHFDDELNAELQNAELVSELLGASTTFQPRYLTERFQTISVPVGLDMHFYSKYVGFVIGGYAYISKYPSIGLKAGITLGKLK